MDKLEQMSDFFTTRVIGYDEHMINDVEGCKECYKKMATLVPFLRGRILPSFLRRTVPSQAASLESSICLLLPVIFELLSPRGIQG